MAVKKLLSKIVLESEIKHPERDYFLDWLKPSVLLLAN